MRALCLLLLSGCMSAAAKSPLPCWHAEQHMDRDEEIEIRAATSAEAKQVALDSFSRRAPEFEQHIFVEPAESVALRLGADPAQVCR